ncbi:unnamed protein product [Timema podura]|uniref:Calreticulin n=1 Tax=Timema podura TaxID=61482 RepID=A0ABN7PE89_TIMPD|nr:unnamed protein product [Timema podura]
MLFSTICVFMALGYVHADVYLDEKFLDDSWESNWVASEHPGKELGKFVLTHGKFYNDPENDKGTITLTKTWYPFYCALYRISGATRYDVVIHPVRRAKHRIQTSQDARFYALSRKFKPFSNKDKPLVVQFTVKHEQNIDCGGGYVKVFDCSLDQKDMHGETPYLLMFGK